VRFSTALRTPFTTFSPASYQPLHTGFSATPLKNNSKTADLTRSHHANFFVALSKN
jgi:hypothetical protein